MKEIIRALDNQPLAIVDGRKFIINPLTEQIPFTSSELLSETCKLISQKLKKEVTKLVTEEDKGGILVAGTSMITGLPFGMARWYPNGLANQISEKFNMEYCKGNLYLNGILKGDKVAIIDDMVSTGGTMISMIKAIEKTGAEIVQIICVAEKLGYDGIQKIKEETGYDVDIFIKVDVSGKKSKVIL
ncbi:adenine phosphoribosyltransferase [archaeon]|jgi:adenine/guanine phosphoribosyltransferase-like PRPP-binding protein|nr:adenine phosphoribosyltransferase [archaeon]MBT4022339.1 adenine phosphoribosyltransferase [archaeon]MBT4273217.1 adenine phosphoribosyltransferase [archaeon]MBT4461340.1 adenine phosphoribosyltransferase [archaeon]MBT5423791.1 adenine phosphoribosyltransferase [archaeon]